MLLFLFIHLSFYFYLSHIRVFDIIWNSSCFFGMKMFMSNVFWFIVPFNLKTTNLDWKWLCLFVFLVHVCLFWVHICLFWVHICLVLVLFMFMFGLSYLCLCLLISSLCLFILPAERVGPGNPKAAHKAGHNSLFQNQKTWIN